MTTFQVKEEAPKYNFLEDSMIGLGLIGLLLMVFALIYFVIYLLKKVRGRNPILSKKIFYFSLIGGFLLMILSASFLDTGTQGQLQEVEGKNSKLESEVKALKTKAKELEDKVVELESDKEKLSTELSDTEAKLSDSKDQDKEFAAYKKSQEEKIANLESEKKELEEKVNNLEDKVAAANTPSRSSTKASNSGSTASSKNNNATASTVNSGNNNFANCTELRSVYPNGVPSSHPAYQSKMDRDKDGYACER
ncbi:excalibur calcium-binding domain-containing protein [Niallia circulans]